MSKEDFERTVTSLLVYKATIATMDSMKTSVVFIVVSVITILIFFLLYKILYKFIRTVKYKDNNFGKVIYIINNVLIIALFIVVLIFLAKLMIEILTLSK